MLVACLLVGCIVPTVGCIVPTVFAASSGVSDTGSLAKTSTGVNNPPFTKGGLAIESPVSLFQTSDTYGGVVVNGHDYMCIPQYGGTLLVCDLDEFRVVDEVKTNIPTARGLCTDKNGNVWIGGDSFALFCYNPFTGESFNTEPFIDCGSIYQIYSGDDGWLYYGTFHDKGSSIYRFNPETLEFSAYGTTMSYGTYCGDAIQKDNYIYCTISGQEKHTVVMMDKLTGEIIKTQDITKEMLTTRYTSGMSFVSEDLFVVAVMEGIAVFKTETLERISAEEFGIEGPIHRYCTNIIDGKSYFMSRTEGICVYDSATGKASPLGGELATGITRVRCLSLMTVDDERLPNPCIVTFGGMTAEGLNLYCYNLEEKKQVTLIGFIPSSYGVGQAMKAISAGLPGSAELYFGVMYDGPVGVYDLNTRTVTREFATNGQSDYFYWYKDVLYIGNYNGAILTQMKDGRANALFRLNDDQFDQARIHGITGGDDKIFVSTIPDTYRNGGLIAWYDLETELTYVVTGPNPEDVYYAKASQLMVTNTWYSAVTDEVVDFSKEFDQDQDGDGVCRYFNGPIPNQSLKQLYYRDGLLFGVSMVEGGTSSTMPADASAMIFIYDVDQKKMLKVIDLRDYHEDMPSQIYYYGGLTGDPDVPNKYWGIVSETLFSFTYDKDANEIDFKIELSFDIQTQWYGGRVWGPREIIFDGDYMYVCFDRKGGFCKINRNNPSQYEQLVANCKNDLDIPIYFVLGDDGDIYYITGADANVYVINTDITDEERAAAKAVQDLIDAIDDNVTLDSVAAIDAARAAWTAMAPANQPLVNNYQKLVDAENELLPMRLESLGEITLDKELALKNLRATYESMTVEQRLAVDLRQLSEAEGKMSELVAKRVADQIAAIGEVTADKEEQIRACRAAYVKLSRYEQMLVDNVEVLSAAESKLTNLLLGEGGGSQTWVIVAICAGVAIVACAVVVFAVPSVRKKIFKKNTEQAETVEE